MQAHNNPPILPKRIILLRHGESQGNLDAKTYTTIPDNKIPLTEKGLAQAWSAGVQIRDVISCNNTTSNWKVYFYVSPYQRALSTLREIGLSFSRKEIISVDEDCRIREQTFGNLQDEKKMKELKIKKEEYGHFFYRFPDGESIADLSDRVSGH
nr:phosphoglycerate mutase-like protein at74h [Quercus suber]